MIRKNSPLFLAFLFALSLDIVSKLMANQILAVFKPIPIVGDWLRLTLNYNIGVASPRSSSRCGRGSFLPQPVGQWV